MEYIYILCIKREERGFALKGQVKEFDLWNGCNKGLSGVQFFECLSY